MPPDRATLSAMAKRLDRLIADRGNWNAHWEECQNFVKPRRGWTTSVGVGGQKYGQMIYDNTPGHASKYLQSGLSTFLTSSANKWFAIKLSRPELNEQFEIKQWLDMVQERIEGLFQQSNFYLEIAEIYSDLACVGTAPMLAEEMGPGVPIPARFQALPVRDCYIAENAWGIVDTAYEIVHISARNLAMRFGTESLLDRHIRMAQAKPDEMVEIIHAVIPRAERMPWSRSTLNAPWADLYFERKELHLFRESGHYEFPFIVPRWTKETTEIYGRSPTMDALGDIKMLNQMRATNIRSAQRVADPPLLMPHNSVVGGMRMEPGQVTYIRWDTLQRGFRPGPLTTGANVPLALEYEQAQRDMVRQAFFVDLFLLLLERPQMTATEVVQRNEEKMALLGPVLGRLMSEMLDPLIKRSYGILSRADLIPAPPMDLKGMNLIVEYVSPLARAQKLWEVRAIQDTVAFMAPLATVYQDVWDNFDGDAIARLVAELYGCPNKVLRSEASREEFRQAKLEQMQREQAMAEASALAEGVSKLGNVLPFTRPPQGQGFPVAI